MDTEIEFVPESDFIGWASDEDVSVPYDRRLDDEPRDVRTVDALTTQLATALTFKPAPRDTVWEDIVDAACDLLKLRMKQDGDSLLYRGDKDGFDETAFSARFCDALRAVIEQRQGISVVGPGAINTGAALNCPFQVIPEYRLMLDKGQSELRADVVVIDTSDPGVENVDGVIGRPVAIIELKYLRYGFLRHLRDTKMGFVKDLQSVTPMGRTAIIDRMRYIDKRFADLNVSRDRYRALLNGDWAMFQMTMTDPKSTKADAKHVPIPEILQNAKKQVNVYKARLRDDRIRALVVIGVGREVFQWLGPSTTTLK